MRYKVVFHPEDYCLGENERFYTEMAKKGWRLESRGRCLSRFERRECAEELYRIEVDYRDFPEDRLELYRECGWEFVTKYGFVNVFRGDAGGDLPELYADPAEQAATVRRMRRRGRLTNLAGTALLLVYLALLLPMGGGVKGLGAAICYQAVNLPGLLAAFASLLVYSIILGMDGWVRIRRLIKRLEGGLPLDHTPKRRGTAHIWAIIAVVALCLGTVAAQLATLRRMEPMPEKSDGVYITLADAGFGGDRCGVMSDRDESRVQRVWSPTADITHTRETVEAGGDWVSMDQDVYRLRIPALAKPLAAALIERAVFARDASEYVEIDVPGWDTVRVSSMECVALRGATAVHVYILLPGDTTMEERHETFARILTGIAERIDALT